jgi:hypothetical protein
MIHRGRYWSSSPLGTSCTGRRTEETLTICRTLCGASRHIIIPWVLFGITDNSYSKSSTNNRLWCTIHIIILPVALASPLIILLLKRKAYNSLAGQYSCEHTQLLCPGAWSTRINILSNGLPCLHHLSIHLASWTTTVSGLLWCSIVTVMPFALYIFGRRIPNAQDPEVCKSRLAHWSGWNGEKLNVRVLIFSDMLISSGTVRGSIVLRLLTTPSMQGIQPGNNLSDARESPRRSFLHISVFSERGSHLTICCKILNFELIWNRHVCHCNLCGIQLTLLDAR